MTWKERNTQRLATVHPILCDRVQRFINHLESIGIEVLVVFGVRTYEEQAALYAQGRSAPGNIVTHAKPGWSSHQFGLAVDLVPVLVSEGVADWNAAHPSWKTMLSLAPQFQLAEGATWRSFPDNPHFYPEELNTISHGDTPSDDIRAAYDAGGLPKVWELLADKFITRSENATPNVELTSEG